MILRCLVTILVFAAAGLARAAVITTTQVTLDFEGRKYQFDLYKSAGADAEIRPAVVLVPEYWGKDRLEVAPARRLAERGYVVLVVDLYGDGRSATTTEAADRLVENAESKGIDRVIDLIDRAVEHLKHRDGIDSTRIGAVGFGYGGGLVYNLAKRGNSGLAAVVSFYGGTKKLRETSRVGRLPELLYIRPERDVYTSPEEFAIFNNELGKSRFSHEILQVERAYYGFIHDGIEMYGGDEGNTFMSHDAERAAFAWNKTYAFLGKILKPNAR